jgi:hypothetical protein
LLGSRAGPLVGGAFRAGLLGGDCSIDAFPGGCPSAFSGHLLPLACCDHRKITLQFVSSLASPGLALAAAAFLSSLLISSNKTELASHHYQRLTAVANNNDDDDDDSAQASTTLL